MVGSGLVSAISRVRSFSGPTPHAAATSLVSFGVEITSRYNSSLDSYENFLRDVVSLLFLPEAPLS